jgi:hypothetical protein
MHIPLATVAYVASLAASRIARPISTTTEPFDSDTSDSQTQIEHGGTAIKKLSASDRAHRHGPCVELTVPLVQDERGKLAFSTTTPLIPGTRAKAYGVLLGRLGLVN